MNIFFVNSDSERLVLSMIELFRRSFETSTTVATEKWILRWKV